MKMLDKETLLEIMGSTIFIIACLVIWLATLVPAGYSAVIATLGIIEILCSLYMFFKAENMREKRA